MSNRRVLDRQNGPIVLVGYSYGGSIITVAGTDPRAKALIYVAALRRRSQNARLSWERFIRIADRFFPPIKVLHPLPAHRFDAKTRGRSPVR